MTWAGEHLSVLSETAARKQCEAPGGNSALLRSWRGRRWAKRCPLPEHAWLLSSQQRCRAVGSGVQWFVHLQKK